MAQVVAKSTATVGQFIDGVWTAPHADTFEVRNPANGDLVGRVSKATRQDAEAAVEAAARAFPAWHALGGKARAEMLRKVALVFESRKEEIAQLVSREEGKVLPEARGEVEGALDNFWYYNSFARTLHGQEVALLPKGES